MFGIGATELIIVLVLALIIFGPGKLPEVGKAIGRGIKEFKRAQTALEDDTTSEDKAPAQAAATTKDGAAQEPNKG